MSAIEPWILFALDATSIQTARNILQKNLTARLSVRGSAYARFLYGLPLSFVLLAGAAGATDVGMPRPETLFYFYVVIGAFTQVVASALFIHLMTHANFAISLTFGKIETVLAAAFSFVVMGDLLSPLGAAGILVSVLGCMVLAAGREHLSLRTMIFALGSRAAAQGIGIGAIYAVTSTVYRAATLSLDGGTPVLNAFYALVWVTSLQAVGFGLYLAMRERAVLLEVFRSWRPSMWIGLTGVTASSCWYAAFAYKETAYVLAVGNFDLVLGYLASRFLYREHTNAVEIAGIVLTMAGIICVAFAR